MEDKMVISVGNGRNFIVIEDSMGAMDHKFRSRLTESNGYGSGDTEEEAAMAVVACIRKEADEMEMAIKEKFALG